MSTPVKIGLIAVLVAAVIGAGFLGSRVALAQRAAAQPATASGQPGFFGPMTGGFGGFGPNGRDGFGFGGMMGGGWMAAYSSQMHAAVASALGMTTDEFDKGLAAGKSPWQMAQEKGISASDFTTKMTDAMSQVLKQAVADGKLTQAQADAMLARMKQGVGPDMMFGGPGMRGGGGRPRGNRPGAPWDDQNNQ
jgi:hypothetical protein